MADRRAMLLQGAARVRRRDRGRDAARGHARRSGRRRAEADTAGAGDQQCRCEHENMQGGAAHARVYRVAGGTVDTNDGRAATALYHRSKCERPALQRKRGIPASRPKAHASVICGMFNGPHISGWLT
jgi:hypothetical protein